MAKLNKVREELSQRFVLVPSVGVHIRIPEAFLHPDRLKCCHGNESRCIFFV